MATTSVAGGGGSDSLVGAIDQGTGSTRFLLFDSSCKVIAKEQREIEQRFPKEGWFEQDSKELVSSVRECLEGVWSGLSEWQRTRVKGIGLTNQRETTVLWDRITGQPLHNAVVWCDGRTDEIAERLVAKTESGDKNHFRDRCGLPIHAYFSALKIRWLIENSPRVRAAIDEGRCLFGTVDSWLIWNLTGGVSSDCHVTDVTNASRTMLMNIHTLEWDPELCDFFGIPMEILPKIKSSAEHYGEIAEGAFKGVSICGCLGDQQAALVGQQCFKAGDAKNTYGTGCFLLYNTGEHPVMSRHGMLTTVAYKLGPSQPVTYALEGAVSIAGQSVRWLRDNLGFFDDVSKIAELAGSVEDTGDVYFVPAFSGLYAPYWRPDARGLIIGLTNYTNKAHLCRATLEAVCFQSREILEAMNQDSHLPLSSLRVDGGMTGNRLLLHLQADILGLCVVRPDFNEMTVLGAAIAAGVACGVWPDPTMVPTSDCTTYLPRITSEERDARYARWKQAVQRCMNWHGGRSRSSQEDTKNSGKSLLLFTLGCVTGAVVGGALLLSLRRR